jgi:hypothetical protein
MGEQRIQERDRLLTELGFVLGPLKGLLSGETSKEQLPFIHPRTVRDYGAFTEGLHKYATASDGTVFSSEYSAVVNALHSMIEHCFAKLRAGNDQAARDYFDLQLPFVRVSIRAIPCEQPEGVFSAETPFKTYQTLRAVFATVGKQVDLIDPYLDAEVFHLYLSQVPPTAQVNLVTSESIMVGCKSKKDEARRDRIVEVSKMFAAERPKTYRFAVVKGSKSLHDRHLRADDAIYHLGGSLKDASDTAPYTLSKLPKIAGDELDKIVAAADPWFDSTMDWRAHRIT